jgi:hypothetical protein
MAGYNREAARAYAARWYNGRNPEFYDFDALGGDCTNFASQCLYAGCGVFNYTPVTGWYYTNLNRRAPSFTGVQYLYNFLIHNAGAGPYGIESPLLSAQIGDIIQLSFDGAGFAHTAMVTQTGALPSADSIAVSAHTHDVYDKPLNASSTRKRG